MSGVCLQEVAVSPAGLRTDWGQTASDSVLCRIGVPQRLEGL